MEVSLSNIAARKPNATERLQSALGSPSNRLSPSPKASVVLPRLHLLLISDNHYQISHQ